MVPTIAPGDDVSSRRRGPWSARPPPARRGPRRRGGPSGGGRCPSMCAATARSSTACPSGVKTTWTLRRSFGQFCRATSPASTMRSTRRVTPPVVSATSLLSAAHRQAAVGRGPDVDEDVEEDQRDPDVLLELAAEAVGEAAVGPDDQAHELDPLVVHLAQDAAGAPSSGAQPLPGPRPRPASRWSPFPYPPRPQSPPNARTMPSIPD